MTDLFDIAVYIVGTCKTKGCDPMVAGDRVTRELRLLSTDAETLFSSIILARRFELANEDRMLEIRQTYEGATRFQRVVAATEQSIAV